MIYRAMEACGVWSPRAVVAVGDTIAAERMRAAGADAVIESVADLPALLPRLVAG